MGRHFRLGAIRLLLIVFVVWAAGARYELLALSFAQASAMTPQVGAPDAAPDAITVPRPLACVAGEVCAAMSARVASVRVLQRGARPRWSPTGDQIVFDRRNDDDFYDVYLMDLDGNISSSLTENNPGINQRNNGNAIFHPTGQFVVFLSEEPQHFASQANWVGDPGLGIYCNLWATDPSGSRFWKLTDISIKQTLTDGLPSVGVVNPHFSPDGEALVWTERYAEGGMFNWGRWRIRMADFVVVGGEPQLANERVVFTPQRGNYVTAMAFVDQQHLLVAGNLDGQHVYGMDQYIVDLPTGQATNLTGTPDLWEEDSTILPDGRIVYMSNATSRRALDFANPDWPSQPREREYWVMDPDGGNKERLTYFNDETAPEYMGRRAIVASSDVSPDGRTLLGTFGVDYGSDSLAAIDLQVILIELRETP